MQKIPIQITVGVESAFRISHSAKILLLGSCFADHIGSRLERAGFDALCNPFGTLYNPLSIQQCLARSVSGKLLTEEDLVFHDGQWHSWLHHGKFSSTSRERCLAACNESLTRTADFLRKCDVVAVTLGTAFVYQLLAQNGRVVANCHRVPPTAFERRRMTVDECVAALNELPLQGKRVIATVSPIRHLADGAFGNQLSKSTLLLAVKAWIESCEARPKDENAPQIQYFPAYEIMMDELRDYRFYDRDLTHPSELAVDIIWHHFQEGFFSTATQNLCDHNEKHYRQQQHRPISNN